MNGPHFWAFVWLRWRLFVNQMRKGGLANTIILAILAGGAILLALIAFVSTFAIGVLAMPEAEPAIHMFAWDGLALFFLFLWASGVLAELQRSEALSLEKLLHLPVSLWGAFVLNYLSSLFSLVLILYLPGLIGFIFGMAIGVGPDMLLMLPLLAGFLLMVTAITYQFQGWLASLMVNKRRRRTVIVAATLLLVGVAQLPNLANLYWLGDRKHDQPARKAAPRTAEQIKAQEKEAIKEAADIIGLFSLALPPAWLGLGAKAVAEGNMLVASLCMFGMTLIGVVSLRRAYRTTLRMYTGQFTAGDRTGPPKSTTPDREPSTAGGRRSANLLEKELPWISEQAAVVALAAFRSFLRAPEVKMLLLSPVLLLLVFGGVFFRAPLDMTPAMRPLLMFGGLCMALFFLMNLLNNQFGFDRGGFRVFVLSPVRRRDILLGKNMSVVPFGLIFGILIVGALQVIYPLPLTHFLAVPFQAVSMFLLYCMLANCLSILAPIRMAPGAMKATNVKLLPVLLHLLFFFTFPLAMSPALLPLAIENMLGLEGVPICLLLSVVECAGIIFFYHHVLNWQGLFLQVREQAILEAVTTKAE